MPLKKLVSYKVTLLLQDERAKQKKYNFFELPNSAMTLIAQDRFQNENNVRNSESLHHKQDQPSATVHFI